jgi:phospholipid/cholesterol/gamma-HCH transport system ATP-binding protein
MTGDTSKPLIEANNLSVRFGRQQVLRSLNVAVPRGQTLCVIGESGCGKTVFLKTLIGLTNPTKGDVHFEGKKLADLSEREIAKERTRYGFLFQGAALFDSLTVIQNVAFPLKEHTDKSPAEIRETVMKKIAEVGLPNEALDKRPAELSGGMRKRVGLARALAMNPEIMLYDEPTTGLDPIMSDVINQLMLNTKKLYSVTSIVVTHDMNTVRRVADRVIMFFPLANLKSDEPQIVFDGPPDALERSADKRVAQFVRGEAGPRLKEMYKSSN